MLLSAKKTCGESPNQLLTKPVGSSIFENVEIVQECEFSANFIAVASVAQIQEVHVESLGQSKQVRSAQISNM